MHLRAAGIYKISGGLGGPWPLADFYVLGWRLARYAEISGWLEPWYDTGFHMDVKYFVSDQWQMHNIALGWYFNT